MIRCLSSPARFLNHWGGCPQCLQIAYTNLVYRPAGVYLKNLLLLRSLCHLATDQTKTASILCLVQRWFSPNCKSLSSASCPKLSGLCIAGLYFGKGGRSIQIASAAAHALTSCATFSCAPVQYKTISKETARFGALAGIAPYLCVMISIFSPVLSYMVMLLWYSSQTRTQ
jgi:hypothetical protein